MPRIPAFRPATNSSGAEPEARIADTSVDVLGGFGTLLAGGTREGLAIKRNKARREQSAEAQAEGLDPIALAELERERAERGQTAATVRIRETKDVLDAIVSQEAERPFGSLPNEMKAYSEVTDRLHKELSKTEQLLSQLQSPELVQAELDQLGGAAQAAIDRAARARIQTAKIETHRSFAASELEAVPKRVNTPEWLEEGYRAGVAGVRATVRLAGGSEAEADEMARQYGQTYRAQTVMAMADQGDFEGARQTLSLHASELGEDQVAYQEARITRLEGEAAKARDDEERKTAFQHKTRLTLEYSDGRKGIEDIRLASADGTFSAPELAQFEAEDEARQVERTRQEKLFARGEAFYTGKVQASTISAEDEEAINAHFIAFRDALDPEDPTYTAALIDYVKRVGFVPDALLTEIYRGLNLTDLVDLDSNPDAATINKKRFEDAERSVRLGEAVRDSAPKAWGELNKWLQTRISVYGMLLDYYGPQTAHKMMLARESETVTDRKRRKERFEAYFGMQLNGFRDYEIYQRFDHDGGFFDFKPWIPKTMRKEFNALLFEHFTGAIVPFDELFDRVAKLMRTRWGVSYLSYEDKDRGGKAFTRDAPELHYGLEGLTAKENSEWIAAQAIEEARKAGVSDNVLAHGIRLEAHPAVIGPDGRPAYRILIRHEGADGKVTWQPIKAERDAGFVPVPPGG